MDGGGCLLMVKGLAPQTGWLNSFFTPDCHFCQFQARLNAVMLNVVAKQLIANPAFEVL
jgi:hypothetical protein